VNSRVYADPADKPFCLCWDERLRRARTAAMAAASPAYSRMACRASGGSAGKIAAIKMTATKIR
jgi:hypothetical protein